MGWRSSRHSNVCHRAPLLGGHLRLVATRANGQPAFGCYLPDAQAEIVRGYGLIALALEGDLVSEITWFGDRSLFSHFGLARDALLVDGNQGN